MRHETVVESTAAAESSCACASTTAPSEYTLELSRILGAQLLEETRESLPTFLERIAECVRCFTHSIGALAFGLDAGGVTAIGSTGLNPSTSFDLLEEYQPSSNPLRSTERDWAQISATTNDAIIGWALHLRLASAPNLTGCLILTVDASGIRPDPSALEVVARHSALLAAAIEAALRAEAWWRAERLHRLIRELAPAAGSVAGWDFHAFAGQLRDIYAADKAALFVLAGNGVQLSASDPPEEAPPIPLGLSVESLVPGVLDSQGSLRSPGIPNGKTQKARVAVPIKAGGRLWGVLELVRNSYLDHFSASDESSLEAFGDLVGSALASWYHYQYFAAITDSETEAIAVTQLVQAPDGNSMPVIVMANPGMLKLLGRTQDELVGRDARAMYVPGAYRLVKSALVDAIKQAKGTGQGVCGPLASTLLKIDGTPVPVRISFRLRESTHVRPPFRFTLAVAHDQTESERLAERHFRFLELLDAMKIAYFKVDPDGKTLESSETEFSLTGYSFDDLQLMNRKDLYADPRVRETVLETARQSPGKIKRFLLRLRRKDKSVFLAEGDLRVAYSSDGFELVEGFYRDVSERVQMQGFLNSATDRVLSDNELFEALERDSKAQMNYLASVGHQIRTPLSSAIGTLENLQQGIESPDEIRGRLPYVVAQVRACSQLVRNLSYMDRILRGEDIQRSRVSIAKLVIETKLNVEALLESKCLQLKIETHTMDRFLLVNGDRDLLRQVLVNLIDNAIKYSIPRTTILARAYEWKTGRVLEISNVGLPIPEDERKRIFERGFRAAAAKATVPNGTGLGLWLAKEILARHDATIGCVQNECPNGSLTTFRITFPHETAPRGKRRAR